MSGMEGLGRLFNAISVADTKAFSMRDCSAVALLVTSSGAASIAVTASSSFAGSYVAFTPANGFGQTNHWYQATATDGTAAWTKQTAVWTTNSLALAGTTGYTSLVEIFTSQIPDPYSYLKVTCTNATLVVITHSLVVQRKPANLAKLGA